MGVFSCITAEPFTYVRILVGHDVTSPKNRRASSILLRLKHRFQQYSLLSLYKDWFITEYRFSHRIFNLMGDTNIPQDTLRDYLSILNTTYASCSWQFFSQTCQFMVNFGVWQLSIISLNNKTAILPTDYQWDTP